MADNIKLEYSTERATVEVPLPTLKYIDDLMHLKCSPELMASGVFPNAKEVTESFGAYWAAHKLRDHGFSLGDPNVLCVVVGDGNSPRTGITFAYRSNWQVKSIDPRMGDWEEKLKDVQRLEIFKQRIEQCPFEWDGPALIVAVHSHSDPLATWNSVSSPHKAMIAMPCCVPYELSVGRLLHVYDDYGIHSPQRRIKIYLEEKPTPTEDPDLDN